MLISVNTCMEQETADGPFILLLTSVLIRSQNRNKNAQTKFWAPATDVKSHIPHP